MDEEKKILEETEGFMYMAYYLGVKPSMKDLMKLNEQEFEIVTKIRQRRIAEDRLFLVKLFQALRTDIISENVKALNSLETVLLQELETEVPEIQTSQEENVLKKWARSQ